MGWTFMMEWSGAEGIRCLIFQFYSSFLVEPDKSPRYQCCPQYPSFFTISSFGIRLHLIWVNSPRRPSAATLKMLFAYRRNYAKLSLTLRWLRMPFVLFPPSLGLCWRRVLSYINFCSITASLLQHYRFVIIISSACAYKIMLYNLFIITPVITPDGSPLHFPSGVFIKVKSECVDMYSMPPEWEHMSLNGLPYSVTYPSPRVFYSAHYKTNPSEEITSEGFVDLQLVSLLINKTCPLYLTQFQYVHQLSVEMMKVELITNCYLTAWWSLPVLLPG